MQTVQGKVRLREMVIFLTASLALLVSVFGDALIGRSLLAPIDVAPALWAKYHFVNPHTSGVPRNHNLSDQLAYDLPLQHLMHEAWRRGEIPWWNPYTYGGRPLLADAHCNGADPIRVGVYLAVADFVTAYNWTRGLHWIWGSLGLFLLLRKAGNAPMLAGLLALAGEVAGWKTELFGHPWVEGAFCWYPWLWLCWIGQWVRWRPAQPLAGALCTTAVLLAGNLQSHAWLLLFAAAVAWGAIGCPHEWPRTIGRIAFTLAMGTLLAAPLLLAELELFSQSSRALGGGVPMFPIWHAPMAFAALHPWMLGTPATGSYMALGVGSFGFALWAGSVILPLAAVGAFRAANVDPFRRTALALVFAYVLIISTPLYPYLYARYAGLPVMGLLLLAGRGVRQLMAGRAIQPWLGRGLLICAFGILTAGDFVGRWVFPHFQAAYAAKLKGRTQNDGYGGRSMTMRAAQARAIPRELSLVNPEVAAGVLSFLAAALVLSRRELWAKRLWPVLLLLNLIAPVLHARRFIPRATVDEWNRLLTGSEEQKSLIAKAQGEAVFALRVEETTATQENPLAPHDGSRGLFPYEMASLYRLHVVHGYAALAPVDAIARLADESKVNADLRVHTDGLITKRLCRFRLASGAAAVRVSQENLTSIDLETGNVHSDELVWADTPYLGWTATDAHTGARLQMSSGSPVRIAIPRGTTRIVLSYGPTHLKIGLLLAGAGALILPISLFSGLRRKLM